jgi:ribonuclease D
MVEKLKKTGRGAWLDEEMERLADPSSFAFAARGCVEAPQAAEPQPGGARPPEGARRRGARPRRGTKNLPRGRIIKDDTLNEIVLIRPRPRTISAAVRGLSAGWRNNDIGARLMARSPKRPSRSSPTSLPDREPRRPGLTKDGVAGQRPAEAAAQDPRQGNRRRAALIARSDELEALAAGVRKDLNILSGWRFEEFGKDALDLVEGRLAFAIENGKLKMSRVSGRPSMRKLLLLAGRPCSLLRAAPPPPPTARRRASDDARRRDSISSSASPRPANWRRNLRATPARGPALGARRRRW